MTSSIFGQAPKSRFSQAVDTARVVVGSGTPEQAFRSMMATDPRFSKFMIDNAGKDPMQVLGECLAGRYGR